MSETNKSLKKSAVENSGLRKSTLKSKPNQMSSMTSSGGALLNVGQHSNYSLEGSEGTSETNIKGEQFNLTEIENITDTYYPPLRGSYVKPTYSEYERLMLQKSDLFSQVLSIDDDGSAVEQTKKDLAELLITGFGIRNLKSLQDALDLVNERQRLKDLYVKEHTLDIAEEVETTVSTLSSTPVSSSTKITTSTTTETDHTTEKTIGQQQLEYLMGIKESKDEGEEYIPKPISKITEEDFFKFSNSMSTKQAQVYLRLHRIFDFFQYIIAQLLGSHSDNPIIFIIQLLNKCLCYRNGQGKPPLLYEKGHIEQLFNMMDRIGEGVIEMKQYHQGMRTLGICQYNKDPTTTEDGTVEKTVFIEEVYKAELALFDDLINVKTLYEKPKSLAVVKKKSTVSNGVSVASSGSYFMPSNLVRHATPKSDKILENDG